MTKSISTINSEIDSQLPDNTAKLITPLKVRTRLHDVMDWVTDLDARDTASTPTLATMTALRAATSTTLPQTRCYLTDRLTAGDSGGGYFNLIDSGSRDSTYDDAGWHVVDASGRVWARDSNVNLPHHWGVSMVDSQSAAESQADQFTALQLFFDFWADPAANGRSRNIFKSWPLRPRNDRWQRAAYVGPGYAKTSAPIDVQIWARGVTDWMNSPVTGALTMEGAVFVPYAGYYEGFRISFGSKACAAPANFKAVKGLTNVSGTQKAAWDQRAATATIAGSGTSAGACRYPEVAWVDNGMYIPYSASLVVYIKDLVTVTHASGAKYLYRVTADGTLPGSAPTHTSGTTNNLECLGEYVTPTVSGGGQFDVPDIAGSERCVGIRVVSVAYIEPGVLNFEAQNFAIQVSMKPDTSDSKTSASLYAHFSVGQAYGCKIQFAQIGTPTVDNALGWVNGMHYQFTGFNPLITGSNQTIGTDKSLYAVLLINDPTAAGSYQSNGNEFMDISVEGQTRTGNAEIIQICCLSGKENYFECREDVPSYVTVRYGMAQKMADRPVLNTVKAERIGKIDDNWMANDFLQYNQALSFTNKVIDYHDGTFSGAASGTVGSQGMFYPPTFTWWSGSNIPRTGVTLNTGVTWHPGTRLFDFIDNTELPAVMVNFGRNGTTAAYQYEWSVIDFEVLGDTPSGRVSIYIVDASTIATISPQRYPSFDLGGGLHDPTGVNPIDGSNAYCTTNISAYGADGSGKQSWGIAPWVRSVVIIFRHNNTSGISINVRSTRSCSINTSTFQPGVKNPPEHGTYMGGHLVRFWDSAVGTSTQTHYRLGLAGNTAYAQPFEYYAVSGTYATSTAVLAGQLYAHNVSGGSGDIYRALTGHTTSGASPGADSGGTWVLEKTGVKIALPSDWVKV